MLEHVGAEALQVVLHEEDAHELRIANLYQHVPRQHDSEIDGESRQPEHAREHFEVAQHQAERDNNQQCQERCDGPLRERRQRQEEIGDAKPALLVSLQPGIPRQKRDPEHRRQWHVGGGSPRETNHSYR